MATKGEQMWQQFQQSHQLKQDSGISSYRELGLATEAARAQNPGVKMSISDIIQNVTGSEFNKRRELPVSNESDVRHWFQRSLQTIDEMVAYNADNEGKFTKDYGGVLGPRVKELLNSADNVSRYLQSHGDSEMYSQWDQALIQYRQALQGLDNYNSEARAYYGQFKDETEYGWGQKYIGQDVSQLRSAAAGLEDGDEKAWLTGYADSLEYNNALNYDMDKGAQELQELETRRRDMQGKNDKWWQYQNNPLMHSYLYQSTVGGNEYEQLKAEMEVFEKEGGLAGLDQQIRDKRAEIAKARNVQGEAQQQKDHEAWLKTVRAPEVVGRELEAARAQAAQLKSSYDTVGGKLDGEGLRTSGGESALDIATAFNKAKTDYQKAAEKVSQLEKEMWWAQKQGYDKLQENKDFAQNSVYVPTISQDFRNGGKGREVFTDPMYEYINRNDSVVSQRMAQDQESGAIYAGTDWTPLLMMQEGEVKTYNYLYATQGKEAASRYVEHLRSELNARQRATDESAAAQVANAGKMGQWFASGMSVLTAPFRGLAYLGQAADLMTTGKIDQNAGYNRVAYTSKATRDTVSQSIESNPKWGKAGAFGYQVAMSMGDFLMSSALSGGSSNLASLILGTGAAADAVVEAKDRGLSDVQAFSLGTIAGIAEQLTEKYSLETLLDADVLKDSVLKYIRKNMLAEASEEAASSVINLVADILISEDKSQWQQSMQQFQDQGYSREEAFVKAVAQQAAAIGLDALGGAISGGVLGSGQAVNFSLQARGAGKVAGALGMDQQAAQQFVNAGLQAAPDSTARQVAEQMQSKLNQGKTLTDQDKGRLVYSDPKLANQMTRANAGTVRLATPQVDVGNTDERWQQAQRLAGITGRNIVFYNGVKSENGYYDNKTGEIYINANGPEAAVQTFSHELTHSAELAEVYKDLEALCFQKLRSLGQDVAQMRQDKMAQYENAGHPLASKQEANAEIVADFVAKYLLTDERTIFDVVMDSPTVGQRILRWIDGWLAKFGNENARERVFLDNARKIYSKALEQTRSRQWTEPKKAAPESGTGEGQAAQTAQQESQSRDSMTEEEYYEAFWNGQLSRDVYDAALENGEIDEEAYDMLVPDAENEKTSPGEGDGDDFIRGDGRRYSLSENDILKIQSIGDKSINDFTSNDIKATEWLAKQYWDILKVKSPFFRAWFGDWRVNDQQKVSVANILGDTRTALTNIDTGWTIQNSGQVHNETKNHRSIKSREAISFLPYIDDIISKAILLDTYGIDPQKVKSPNSLLMHSFYAVADAGSGPRVLKLYVEEMYDPNSKSTNNRAYHLQNIEIAFVASVRVQGSPPSSLTNTTNAISNVADLFAAVKQMDSKFNPADSSLVVDSEGNPVPVYHQTGEEFYIFDTKREGAGSSDSQTPYGIFLKKSDRDIGLKGKRQMELYANIRNPLKATDRHDLIGKLHSISPAYKAISDQLERVNSEYKARYESATQAIDDYLKEWRSNNPGASRREIFNDQKFNELHDAEDLIVEEWDAEDRRISARAKAAVTRDLKKSGYDGIFLSNDAGSWGRSTDAIIALDPAQVKSVNENVGTFDKKNPDIRYSISSSAASSQKSGNAQQQVSVRDDLSRKTLSKLEGIEDKLVRDVGKAFAFPKQARQTQLLPVIRQMIDSYLQTGKLTDKILETGFSSAYDAAGTSIQELVDKYSETLDILKNAELEISEEEAAKIPDFNKVIRFMSGTVRFAEQGQSVDTVYGKLREAAPDLFPERYKSTSARLQRIYEISQNLYAAERNAEGLAGDDAAEYRKWAKRDFKEIVESQLSQLQVVKTEAAHDRKAAAQARAENAARQAQQPAKPSQPQETKTPPDINQEVRNNLDWKSTEYLTKVENRFIRRLGERLGIPRYAQYDVMRPVIQQMVDEYLQTGKISDETIRKAFDTAYDQGKVMDREFYDQYKEVKDYLRTTGVTLSQRDQSDIPDFNQWRKSVFGSLRMVNDGMPVDSAYQQLQEMAPELFPSRITHPADQLMRMAEVSKQIRKVEKSLDEYYGPEADTFRSWARHDFGTSLRDIIPELRTVRRYAEQGERKIEQLPPLKDGQEAQAAFRAKDRAQWEKRKAIQKNLLTAKENKIVKDLIDGLTTLEQLKSEDVNLKGIQAVYEATLEYEKIDRQIRQYQASLREKRQAEADELLKSSIYWKDKKSGFAYARETMRRNILDIVSNKDDAYALLRTYFEPVQAAEAERQRFLNEFRDKVRQLNLSQTPAKGDEVSEAYAVQLYGEAITSIEMIQNSNGRIEERDGRDLDDWQGLILDMYEHSPSLDKEKIENAVKEFRAMYDDFFARMNEVLVRNGYPPVDYRKGYFPHFQGQDDGVAARFSRLLGVNVLDDVLPTTINGMTHKFRPGKQWFAHAQERTGFQTTYDAVEGFDKYIEGVSNVIYHTDNIQKLRALARQIRYRSSDEGIREQISQIEMDDSLAEEDKQNRIDKIYENGRFALSNFVRELDEYTNILAGKKSMADRSAEHWLSRKYYTWMKALEAQIGANMVGGNLTSALTNFIPLTQAWGQLDTTNLLDGMRDTLMAMKQSDGFAAGSDFLTRRKGSEKLSQTWIQKASARASLPMELIDGFASEAIVRGAYYQNIKKGMSEDEALRQADIFAANVMADRSKGALPTIFEMRNPVAKIFTQFQTEVNNQMSEVFKDLPRAAREKTSREIVAMVFKYFFGAWLFNEIYELLIGRRPALDPINMAWETVEDWQEGGLFVAGQNLANSVIENLPFVSGIAGGGRVPMASALPDVGEVWRAFAEKPYDEESGEGMAMRKRLNVLGTELAKPAMLIAFPFGGNQVMKAWKGIKTVLQGGSYNMTNSGEKQLQYAVDTSDPFSLFGKLLMASVMGKSALPEARAWTAANFNTFKPYQTAVYDDLVEAGVKAQDAWNLVDSLRSAADSDARRKLIGESKVSEEAKAIAYYGMVAGDKDRALMDKLTDLGASAGAAGSIVRILRDADPLPTAEQRVAEADALRESQLTEEEKREVVAHIFGNPTELLTESGNPTEYAKFLTATEGGLSVDSYMAMRAKGADTDDYLGYVDADVPAEKAADLVLKMQDLKPAEGYTTVSYLQRAQVVLDSNLTQQQKLDAMGAVKGMYESTYEKMTLGYEMGVQLQSYIDLRKAMPQYDANDNGSYTQKETRAAIDGALPYLSDQEKAVLWQLQNKTWKAKSNPYDKEIGQKVSDAMQAMSDEAHEIAYDDPYALMKALSIIP